MVGPIPIPEITAQTPMNLTICGNEFVFNAKGVFSSFRRHIFLKDKFT
jgi:hypothetical protein